MGAPFIETAPMPGGDMPGADFPAWSGSSGPAGSGCDLCLLALPFHRRPRSFFALLAFRVASPIVLSLPVFLLFSSAHLHNTPLASLFGFQTDIGLVIAMTSLSLVPGLAMILCVHNHVARGFTIRVRTGRRTPIS